MKGHRIWLEAFNEQGDPWIIPVEKDCFTIGRDANSDLILTSGTISRRHAEICRSSRGFSITDAESLNGTYVNQERITASRFLRRGDVVGIGNHRLTVREADPRREGDAGTVLLGKPGEATGPGARYGLSSREEDVLFHLLRGKTVPETADTLCLAVGTVKNHVNRIYKKVGCHSRMELIKRFGGDKP